MPMTQTWIGIFTGVSGAGVNSRATRPTAVPTAKVIADRRKGGVLPDASVSSARSAHMATAEKPIRVARAIGKPPFSKFGPGSRQYFRTGTYKVSKRRARTVIVPILVPIVACTGAYMPVLPTWANVTMIRLFVARYSSARRPVR